MNQFLPRDRVWIRHFGEVDERDKGFIFIIKPDQSEAVVELEDGSHVRVRTTRLTLRETHE